MNFKENNAFVTNETMFCHRGRFFGAEQIVPCANNQRCRELGRQEEASFEIANVVFSKMILMVEVLSSKFDTETNMMFS